jgi:thiol-disulfide isomerase/thioredoxin
VLTACGQISKEGSNSISKTNIKNGHWLFNFNLGTEMLPFNVFYANKDNEDIIVFKNADEVISTKEVIFRDDSLFVNLPVFGTRLEGKILSDSSLSGYWFNTTKNDDYKIAFNAHFGIEDRFEHSINNHFEDFSGKWEVTFSPESEQPCKAIGIFKQNGALLTGTFLTETGDYRFLEGIASENEMHLSCFDGAHAFLFRAEKNNKSLSGHFWSGNHWDESWTAVKNDDFELNHPDSITYVTDSEKKMDFSFRNLNNQMISLSDPRFDNKVIILQIMGTWCPNCADESKDFAQLYKMYQKQGLEIIAIAYERSENFDVAKNQLVKFKKQVGAEYAFLFAGKADRKKTLSDFEMLNSITSYPTSIFLDRNKKVRKIHTGYYGPGTGEYYYKYKEENEMLIEKMLAEKASS